MQCTYTGIVGMPIVGFWAVFIWVELLQGRTQGGCVVAPTPPLFGPQKSKGKKILKFMRRVFKNVEFCGKKGKKK